MSDSPHDKPPADEPPSPGQSSTQSPDVSQSNATDRDQLVDVSQSHVTDKDEPVDVSQSSATEKDEPSDLRLVPRAMALTVDRYGEPAAQALYLYWRDFLNPMLFGGRLPEPVLRFGTLPPRRLGWYQARDAQGVRSTITIHQRLQDDLGAAKDALIHEAIHMKLYELDGGVAEPEPGYRMHGPLFAAECNRISEILDLRYADGERVVWAPRGRNGEDCGHFPFFSPERASQSSESDSVPITSDASLAERLGDVLVGAALPHIEAVKAEINAMRLDQWLVLQAHISSLIESSQAERCIG